MFDKKRLIFGYLWNLAGNFIVRGIGIISTLFLVRLLTPEDFGIVAIAIAVVGLFDILSGSDTERYLILKTRVTDHEYNAAWTFNLFLKMTAMIALCLVSPFIESYTDIEGLAWVLIATSLIRSISFFTNIGMVKFIKDVSFSELNKLNIASKFVSTIACIIFAFYFRDYRALLVGTFISAIIQVAMSYYLSNHKVRLVFDFQREMVTMSLQIMVRNLISYCRSKLDVLLVGNRFGDLGVGRYTIANQFAILPQTDLVTPGMAPAYSSLSKIKNDTQAFDFKFYQFMFLGYLIMIPCAFGLDIIAIPFVDVVLGDNWEALKPFISTLAFLMLPFFFNGLSTIAYDARKKTLTSIFVELCSIITLVVAFYAIEQETLNEFVNMRVAIGLFYFVAALCMAAAVLKLSLFKMLTAVLLPIMLSLCMYFSLQAIYIEFDNSLFELLVNIPLGALIYSLCLIALYWVLKRFMPNSFAAILFPNINIAQIRLKLTEQFSR